MSKATTESEIEAKLRPETALEAKIIAHPDFRAGLFWGKPRFGHPEGAVINHIPEVFANVDRLDIPEETRRKLRLITLVHDTFKHVEDKGSPRDWSKHHGVYARKFLAKFTDDPSLLTITELHDEAYYCWRLIALYKRPEKGQERLNQLLEKLGDNLQLFYLFFKCDTQTGDKIQTPVKWFEQKVSGIEIVYF
ncbi:MAG: hypothetical protein AAF960_08445 [Bacteroidota bacterium]